MQPFVVSGSLRHFGSEIRFQFISCLKLTKFPFQVNQVSVTTSRLPNRETLMEWPDFCFVIGKLRKTCLGWKRQYLDSRYPEMCESITKSNPTQNSNKVFCKEISRYLNETEYGHLTEKLYKYARENLAIVNIYIKEPVVTKILRDQRIPVIWFVANCGGILGLCMGFSIVTVFEVLHCLVKALFASVSNWYFKVSYFYFLLLFVRSTCSPIYFVP